MILQFIKLIVDYNPITKKSNFKSKNQNSPKSKKEKGKKRKILKAYRLVSLQTTSLRCTEASGVLWVFYCVISLFSSGLSVSFANEWERGK